MARVLASAAKQAWRQAPSAVTAGKGDVLPISQARFATPGFDGSWDEFHRAILASIDPAFVPEAAARTH